MNKIKVTVEYEQPETDRFDALMAEYKAAKAVADEAKETIKPLISAAEEAKYEAICQQLREFGRKLTEALWRNGKYEPLNGYHGFSAGVHNRYGDNVYLHVTAAPCDQGSVSYTFCGEPVMHWDHEDNPNIKHLIRIWNHANVMDTLYGKLQTAWGKEIEKQLSTPGDLAHDLSCVTEG